jgi:hypothetical protein
VAFAIPFFFQFIGANQDQHFTVFFIRIIGEENEHGIFLTDACQPVEIAVLFERIEGITIGGDFVVAVENSDAVFLHFGDEALPVLDEDLGMNVLGMHGQKLILEIRPLR